VGEVLTDQCRIRRVGNARGETVIGQLLMRALPAAGATLGLMRQSAGADRLPQQAQEARDATHAIESR